MLKLIYMKTQRPWLRDGIIAIIIGLLALFILVIFAISSHNIGDGFGQTADSIAKAIGNLLLITPLSNQGFSFLESSIIIIPYLFLLGIGVGWAYRKVKNTA
jgi:hypothetical protein